MPGTHGEQTGPLGPQAIAIIAKLAGLKGDAVPVAVAIALAESGGDPSAIHHNADEHRTTDYGLWQINSYWHPEYDAGKLLEPGYNARAMAKISKNGTDWSAWSTYKNGTYKRFLSDAEKGSEPPTVGAGTVVPNVVPNVTAWVGELLKGSRGLLLGMLLASIGGGLVLLGLSKFARDSGALEEATNVAGIAATAAAL